MSLLSALLLSLPFFEQCSGLLLLIAFVPLLMVEADLGAKGKKCAWQWAFLTFVVWNLTTTYWIMNATFWGMVGAVVATAALMTFVFWLFTVVKRHSTAALGYVAFVAFWIMWEHFFLNAEISWPWLTLGNGLSKDIALIQWYELTGALGGSCWVLVANVLIFYLLKQLTSPSSPQKNKPQKSLFIVFALWLIIPIIGSVARFCTYTTPAGEPCKVAVLQPNIDPFNDKFDGVSVQQQLNILLQLADSVVDSTTQYVIAPETALHKTWENRINSNASIEQIKNFCQQHPQIKFVTGATTMYEYADGDTISYTARSFIDDKQHFYDIYNSALQIDTGASVGIYHKSKLVVGVEMLPYPKYLRFLDKWAIDLGGSAGGLGTQKERTVFYNPDSAYRVGVAICYESVYGEFCTQYVQKGANLLFIITNDGWWRNTPGHRQHLNYARLRAIETRRDLARSANTGISAIINQRGQILHRTQWWTKDAFAATLTTNAAITPYVRYGDWLAILAGLVALMTIGITIAKRKFFKSKNNPQG